MVNEIKRESMRGMNRVMLVGNLGKDPELKQLADGVSVARVSLATTEVYRDKAGNKVGNTQWHVVIFWRSLAQLVAKYLRKGSLIYVEGKLQYRKYRDKEGVERYVTEIMANQLLMLDKRVVEVEAEEAEDDTVPF